MKLAFRSLLLTVLAFALMGMAQKPPGIIVRFFVEANKQDSATFSSPVMLKTPPRQAFMEKIPALSERSFRAIFPFRAADGTWGCAFKLDEKGRLDLETLSTSKRGFALVPVVTTKLGNHQIPEMVIDRPVKDGIVSIPGELTELEIAELRKAYPVIGEKPKNAGKSKKNDAENTPVPGAHVREE
jgi:hypothetical protein